MRKKLITVTLMITIISSIGKILGLLRESSLATYFGMSKDTDAFKIAFSIPDIFASIICVAIVQVFIPIYSNILKEKNEERTKRFLNSTYTLICLVSIVITMFGIIMCRAFIKIIAPGFDDETINKTVTLALIIFPGTIFYILGSLISSHLQIHGRFIASSLIWVSYNICIIIALIFFSKFGIICAAIGALIGLIGMLIIQVPSLKSEGFKFRFSLDFKDEGLREIGILIIPVIIASAFNQIYNIINRMLASGLDNGSITAMDYSYRVAMIIYGVFIASLITAMYPSMASQGNNNIEFKKTISKVLSVGGIISLPLVTLVFILRVPIVQVLFQRGAFTKEDTTITAGVLGFTVFVVVGITFREILNRAFYSLKDTKVPMINGISVIILNIVLNMCLVKVIGVNGLALGTSISSFVSAAMLYFYLYRKMGGIQTKVITDCLFKPLFASFIMGAFVLFSKIFLENYINFGEGLVPSLVEILSYSLFGILVYVMVIFKLNILELNEFKEKLLFRINSKIITVGVKK